MASRPERSHMDRLGCFKRVGVTNVTNQDEVLLMLQKWVTNAFFQESILYRIFILKGVRICNKSNKVTL